jgi:peptidoglycan hydrolase-like protein with peptidoglycan-binding domain
MTAADVQKILINLGYLSGKADGKIGKQSIGALKKFQKETGLPETGKIDPETIGRLRAAKNK